MQENADLVAPVHFVALSSQEVKGGGEIRNFPDSIFKTQTCKDDEQTHPIGRAIDVLMRLLHIVGGHGDDGGDTSFFSAVFNALTTDNPFTEKYT